MTAWKGKTSAARHHGAFKDTVPSAGQPRGGLHRRLPAQREALTHPLLLLLGQIIAEEALQELSTDIATHPPLLTFCCRRRGEISFPRHTSPPPSPPFCPLCPCRCFTPSFLSCAHTAVALPAFCFHWRHLAAPGFVALCSYFGSTVFRAHKGLSRSSSASDQVGLNGPEMTALDSLQALPLGWASETTKRGSTGAAENLQTPHTQSASSHGQISRTTFWPLCFFQLERQLHREAAARERG